VTHSGPAVRATATYWLLPLGFILHDAEEFVTMTDWIGRHHDELEKIAALGPLARRLVQSVPVSRAEVGVTMFLELAALVAVTGLATRRPDSRMRLYPYSALLGVFVVHAFTHALQVFIFHSYVPGVISAVTVVPAVGLIVYHRLFTDTALTPRIALAATLGGAAVFLPLFAWFVAVARWVERAVG
jgi:hypothetical protein